MGKGASLGFQGTFSYYRYSRASTQSLSPAVNALHCSRIEILLCIWLWASTLLPEGSAFLFLNFTLSAFFQNHKYFTLICSIVGRVLSFVFYMPSAYIALIVSLRLSFNTDKINNILECTFDFVQNHLASFKVLAPLFRCSSAIKEVP